MTGQMMSSAPWAARDNVNCTTRGSPLHPGLRSSRLDGSWCTFLMRICATDTPNSSRRAFLTSTTCRPMTHGYRSSMRRVVQNEVPVAISSATFPSLPSTRQTQASRAIPSNASCGWSNRMSRFAGALKSSSEYDDQRPGCSGSSLSAQERSGPLSRAAACPSLSTELKMPAFLPFEAEAIRLMVGDALTASTLDEVLAVDAAERYEYTGSGYFLTVKHQGLPADRRTLSDPFVVGVAGDVRAGFVVFLGDGELTLECHTWGELDVPSDFRQRPVKVSTAPMNVVDLRGQR